MQWGGDGLGGWEPKAEGRGLAPHDNNGTGLGREDHHSVSVAGEGAGSVRG